MFETIATTLRVVRAILKMKRLRVPSRKTDIRKRMPDKPLCVRYDELLHLRKAVKDAEAKVGKTQQRPSDRSIFE
jgi:hypothetical protein